MKTGSWQQFGKHSRTDFIGAGCVFSPSAMLHQSLMICVPVHFSPGVQIKADVKVDKYSFVNWDAVIYQNVSVGAYCSIGRGVQIGLAAHPTDWLSTHSFQYSADWFPEDPAYLRIERDCEFVQHKKTVIGSDVWMGNGAFVLAGVVVGNGVIIGAGSVVVRNVPDFAVVAGVPARIIRYRFPEDVRARLLKIKWWRRNISELDGVDFQNIELALKHLEEMD